MCSSIDAATSKMSIGWCRSGRLLCTLYVPSVNYCTIKAWQLCCMLVTPAYCWLTCHVHASAFTSSSSTDPTFFFASCLWRHDIGLHGSKVYYILTCGWKLVLCLCNDIFAQNGLRENTSQTLQMTDYFESIAKASYVLQTPSLCKISNETLCVTGTPPISTNHWITFVWKFFRHFFLL